jgi:hypothetical protein
VFQHLNHGLVDEFRVRPLELRVLRGRQPLLHDGVELINSHAAVRLCHNDFEVLNGELGQSFVIAVKDRLERLLALPLGMFPGECFDAVDRKHHLRVDRLLDPQRPVLVERGDALLGREESRARLVGGRPHEVEDCLLGGSIIPGRQRIVPVRLTDSRDRQEHEGHQGSDGASARRD